MLVIKPGPLPRQLVLSTPEPVSLQESFLFRPLHCLGSPKIQSRVGHWVHMCTKGLRAQVAVGACVGAHVYMCVGGCARVYQAVLWAPLLIYELYLLLV